MRARKSFLSTFDRSLYPSSTDWTQESCHFGNLDSISEHTFELDHTLSYESRLDILASYPFSEIELELEDPEPQVGNFTSLFDSIMTLVSLSDFFLYSGVNIEFCTITPWN